jgi:hypothetical protein
MYKREGDLQRPGSIPQVKARMICTETRVRRCAARDTRVLSLGAGQNSRPAPACCRCQGVAGQAPAGPLAPHEKAGSTQVHTSGQVLAYLNMVLCQCWGGVVRDVTEVFCLVDGEVPAGGVFWPATVCVALHHSKNPGTRHAELKYMSFHWPEKL